MNDAPDAITLLKDDHRKVEDLFKQFEDAKGASRKEKLARQICLELIVHTQIEEEIFYPACEGKVDEADLKEAYVEHDSAKVLIGQIEDGTEKADDFYDAKVKVLQEEIEHHVKEEEQRFVGIFSQAKRHGVDMDALGAELAQRKAELMKRYEGKSLPKPKLTTMERSR